MHLIKFSLYFVLDKNLDVSISGDVDEAKALSKPPDDSQGINTTTCDLRPAHTKTPSLLPVQRSVTKVVTGVFLCSPPDDDSDSDAEEEQEKTVSVKADTCNCTQCTLSTTFFSVIKQAAAP